MENTKPLVIAGIPIIIDERVRTYCGCDVILFNPELFVEVADNSTLKEKSSYLAGRNNMPEKQLVVHCKREPHDVYIGRPSIWGNPFSHKEGTLAKYKVATIEEAIKRYEEWLLKQPKLVRHAKLVLKGKVLGCWCKPGPCHGDVLARIANE